MSQRQRLTQALLGVFGTAALAAVLTMSGCGGGGVSVSDTTQGAFPLALPPGFPTPRVPTSNPLTEAKVALGRFLFYDKRLSGNGTQACASCHHQARRAARCNTLGPDRCRRRFACAVSKPSGLV